MCVPLLRSLAEAFATGKSSSSCASWRPGRQMNPKNDEPLRSTRVQPPVASTMGRSPIGYFLQALVSIGWNNRLWFETINFARSLIAELTGLLNQHVEFYFVNEDGGEYKPLPTSYANTCSKVGQRERLPAIRLFSHNPIYTEDWRLVSPGFDPHRVSYAGPNIEPVEGTKHLARASRFLLEKPTDRTNYIGILLTGLLSLDLSVPSQPYCSTVINPSLVNRFSHKSWQSCGWPSCGKRLVQRQRRRVRKASRNNCSSWRHHHHH